MRVVGKIGQASIVEFEDEGLTRRCLLPKTIIRKYGNSIPEDVLHQGIEIGIEVEDAFAEITMPTKYELLEAIRQDGFWTSEDIFGNVSRFQLALTSALSRQIQEILKEMRSSAKVRS